MELTETTLKDVNLAFLGSSTAAGFIARTSASGPHVRIENWGEPCQREQAALNRLIGSRIREARTLAGYSAADFVKLVGLPLGSWVHVEAGREAAPVWLLRRIADQCVTTVDFLVGDTEESERGEISPTLRDIMVRRRHHLERLRMQDALEREGMHVRLAVAEGLAGRFQEAAHELEQTLARVAELNPTWQEMRGGSKLEDCVKRCTRVAGRLGRRMARIRCAESLTLQK